MTSGQETCLSTRGISSSVVSLMNLSTRGISSSVVSLMNLSTRGISSSVVSRMGWRWIQSYLCVLQLALQAAGVLGQFEALLFCLFQQGRHIVQFKLSGERQIGRKLTTATEMCSRSLWIYSDRNDERTEHDHDV